LEVLEAVAATHLETGAPVLTHCEEGRDGMEQIEALVKRGVNLSKVVLSHTDKVLDLGYHRALLETGASLEYDQALRHFDQAEQSTASLIAVMVEAGFANQLMLGTDGARRSLWKTLGGEPGLAYLANNYQSLLARHGIDDSVRHLLMEANPSRWLSYL
jgi:phosphotriesterase-related protein